MVSLIARALFITGDDPRYALRRNLLWIPESVWWFWWKENPYVLSGIEPQFQSLPARSLIDVPTELSRLQGSRYIFLVPSKFLCRKRHFELLHCSLSDGKQLHDFVAIWFYLDPYCCVYTVLVLFIHTKLGCWKFSSTCRSDITWDFGEKRFTNISQATQNF